MSTSHEMFERVVSEKHKQVIDALGVLCRYMPLENSDEKFSASSQVLEALNGLKSVLAPQDVPNWINLLRSPLMQFVKKGRDEDKIKVSNAVMKNLAAACNHQWDFAVTEEQPLNFDRMFEEEKDKTRLSELFDSLIRLLQQCLGSGQIDSVKALAGINRLLATLQKNKSGTYFSTIASTRFAIAFCRNWLIKVLKNCRLLDRSLKHLNRP